MSRTISQTVSGSATDAIATRRLVASDSNGLRYPTAASDKLVGISLQSADGGDYLDVSRTGDETLLDVSGSVSVGDLIGFTGSAGKGAAVTPATFVGWVVGQAISDDLGSGASARCRVTVSPQYLSGSGA